MSREITGPDFPAYVWEPKGDEERLQLTEKDCATVVTALNVARVSYLELAKQMMERDPDVELSAHFKKQAEEAQELQERIREAVGL